VIVSLVRLDVEAIRATSLSMRLATLFSFLAVAAQAEMCPVQDKSQELGSLHSSLLQAETPAQAQALSGKLWMIWLDAPDERAQRLLDLGMRKRAGFDYLGARDTLDELVEYCPEYAEGYNQRAFASFLRQDFLSALFDLEKALELNPQHLGALSGKGLTLMGMGRNEEAQDVLREALKLNPWLPERELIIGTDI